MPKWDSNPRSQCWSGRRQTPLNNAQINTATVNERVGPIWRKVRRALRRNTHCPIITYWLVGHHSTARPQVPDERDGLQLWNVASNILNKQPRTADNGWFSSRVLGSEWNSFHRKCYEMSQRASDYLIGFGRMGWIRLAQERDQWMAVAKKVMNQCTKYCEIV
jgi:hypothetical protein